MDEILGGVAPGERRPVVASLLRQRRPVVAGSLRQRRPVVAGLLRQRRPASAGPRPGGTPAPDRAQSGFTASVPLCGLAAFLLLLAACAHAALRPAEAPQTAVQPPIPADTPFAADSQAIPSTNEALGQILDRASAREWSVRVVTLTGDTFVGRVSRPADDAMRIRLRNVPFDQVRSVDRRETRDHGLTATRLMAGAGVGAMMGLVLRFALAYRADGGPCSACNAAVLGGAAAGLVIAGSSSDGVPVTFTPLWRRE